MTMQPSIHSPQITAQSNLYVLNKAGIFTLLDTQIGETYKVTKGGLVLRHIVDGPTLTIKGEFAFCFNNN